MKRRVPASVDRPSISDHALLRFLQRSGLDVEAVRTALEASLEAAHRAAVSLHGDHDHLIVVDGLTYVVRQSVVTTVMVTANAEARGRLLGRGA